MVQEYARIYKVGFRFKSIPGYTRFGLGSGIYPDIKVGSRFGWNSIPMDPCLGSDSCGIVLPGSVDMHGGRRTGFTDVPGNRRHFLYRDQILGSTILLQFKRHFT